MLTCSRTLIQFVGLCWNQCFRPCTILNHDDACFFFFESWICFLEWLIVNMCFIILQSKCLGTLLKGNILYNNIVTYYTYCNNYYYNMLIYYINNNADQLVLIRIHEHLCEHLYKLIARMKDVNFHVLYNPNA